MPSEAADSVNQSSDAFNSLVGERIAGPELAGFCKWLDESLAADRRAIGLELDSIIQRQHQHLLENCAQRLGDALETRICHGQDDLDDLAQMVNGCQPDKVSSEAPEEKKIWVPGSDGGGLGSPVSDDTDDTKNGEQERVGPRSSTRTSRGSTKSAKRQPWASQSGPAPERWAHMIVESGTFEFTFAFLIVANTIIMAAELQYIGIGVGHKLDYPYFSREKQDVWPGADGIFIGLDWFFGIVFLFEVIVKIVGLRSAFVYDIWNLFDFVIVLSWFVGALTRDIMSLPIDPMLLRMARLARLLRLVKLLRFLHGIDQLYLMMTTLKGSIMVLFWSSLFLLVCQTMFAFLCNQIIVSYYLDTDGQDVVRQRETFEYFGTFSRSMLSMFEITLGNWAPIARNLYENVSAWWVLFALAHKLSMGFAVIGIINGIFIQETFKVAACDDTIMLLQEDRSRRVHAKKMQALFDETDQNGDGLLDREEFNKIVQNPKIKNWLAAQELDASDADTLYSLMVAENHHEGLSALDLVTGVKKLKGGARNLDMAKMMQEQRKMEDCLEKISAMERLVVDSLQQVSSSSSGREKVKLDKPIARAKHESNGLGSALPPFEHENTAQWKDVAQEFFDDSTKIWLETPSVANANGIYQDGNELSLFPQECSANRIESQEFSGDNHSPRGTRPHGLPGRGVLL